LSSYDHKKLIETIFRLDEVPADLNPFLRGYKQTRILDFLRNNALDDELAFHASGEYTFIHSVIVPNDCLFPIDKDDLMGRSLNPYTSIASYISGCGRDDVWIERA